ncbi:MAG: hypothetical protein WC640_03805 [Candidatus Paceibacterota bacterium]|jgi:hypothetical protein
MSKLKIEKRLQTVVKWDFESAGQCIPIPGYDDWLTRLVVSTPSPLFSDSKERFVEIDLSGNSKQGHVPLCELALLGVFPKDIGYQIVQFPTGHAHVCPLKKGETTLDGAIRICFSILTHLGVSLKPDYSPIISIWGKMEISTRTWVSGEQAMRRFCNGPAKELFAKVHCGQWIRLEKYKAFELTEYLVANEKLTALEKILADQPEAKA